MFEIIHKLFAHRRFWHNLSMSELSEIYLSYMLRTMAISIIGIFIPVYLYTLGYLIYEIAIFFASVYIIRILIDPMIAKSIVKFGAKEILKFSYPMMVINLGLLMLLQYVAVPLILVAFAQSLAIGTFFVSFNLEYSYLKHNSKEGSELSLMLILRKLASALGPLIGGLVATWFGITVTIFLAILVTFAAALPLYVNPDKAKVKQLKPLKYQMYEKYSMHLPPLFGIGLVIGSLAVLWPLYLSVYVLGENVYASLGFLVTVSFVVTIFSTKFFGKVIDNKSGRSLLNYSSAANGLFLLVRPFVSTFAGAFFINFASDPVGNGQMMTYQKGFYDTAESEKLNRLNAIIVMSSYVHFARSTLFMLVALIAITFHSPVALNVGFIVGGLGSFLLMAQKFEVYKNG